MNYHMYLYRTRALMDEVMTAMNNLAGTDGRDLRVKDLRTIVQRRGEFQKRLRDCFYSIIDFWPDILSNDARRFEVSTFISRYRAFRLAARTVADSPGLPAPLADSLPGYIRYLDELDGDMSLILSEFSGVFPHPTRPSLAGIAFSLRFYVPEADDAFYERLILDRLTPSHPLKWLRNKVSAALFARHFGLTDKEMNRAFIFPGQGKPARGIKISSNATAKGDDRYGIAGILERYPYDG